MTDKNEQDREDEALDALMVAAWRQRVVHDVPLPDLNDPEPVLSPEDQQALDALGPDLVKRLLKARKKGRKPSSRSRKTRPPSKPRLTGSLHRGEKDGGLSEEARQEMERKIRELEAKDKGNGQP